MLNIVAVQLVTYLLRGPLIDPAQAASGARIPQTERLSPNADLPMILGGTRLHLGVVIAVGMAVAAWVLLWQIERSATGFVPLVPAPKRPAMPGIPVRSMTMLALTLSGALCGLAGAILVFGSESHRFITDGSSTGFTGSAGFNGIVAALFGALHPLWTIPASFLFGGLLVGANVMQREIQIPASLVVALNGIVVLFVVASVDVRRRVLRRTPPAQGGSAPGGHPGVTRRLGAGRRVSEFFTVSVLVATVASAVRLTTPYAFAALGETLGQRSGVLNLGVDGVMLLGAFFAYWVALEQQNLWLAVLAGAAVGTVMGIVYADRHARLPRRAGDQRHRRLPVRARAVRAAVSPAHRHPAAGADAEALGDPAARRHPEGRQDVLRPQPARLRLRPARARCSPC